MNPLIYSKKGAIKKIFYGFILSLFLPYATFAAADPTVLSVSTLKTEVGPGDEVDFIVAYGNATPDAAKDVELLIDFNENELEDISLGNKKECQLGEVLIRCQFKDLPGSTSKTVGFTAKVKTDIAPTDFIRTTATISEAKNTADKPDNNSRENKLALTGVSGAITTQAGLSGAEALKGNSPASKLKAPSENQGLAVFDVSNDKNWQANTWSTMGLKFMIRGKEALAWTLGITNSGFDSEAIRTNHLKVLTVVNSLFIIGLLAIAFMWMFSLFIPRRYLRGVILIYGLAVLLVNFAFPANRLMIDGANLLQKTFMKGVDIQNIVQTPVYNDKKAIGYLNQEGSIQQKQTRQLQLNLATSPDPQKPVPQETVIGNLKQDFLTPTQTGEIKLGKESGTIQLRSTGKESKLSLNTQQSIELLDQTEFNPIQEQSVFVFTMMAATGLAYFAMASLFILRIVILWALLIVSPALLLLGVFRATRRYFISWLSIYGRWLLIGPLMALGLALMISLWKEIGLPISSTYGGAGQFGIATNIGFYLPGKDTVNTLSNTGQMMEYIIFLTMLYLPILFAFMLTRQKMWSAAATVVNEKIQNSNRSSSQINTNQTENTTLKSEGKTEKQGGGLIKDFLSSKLANVPQGSMPESMKTLSRQKSGQPGVGQISSAQLKTMPLKEMLNVASEGLRGSRHAHQKVLTQLANPSQAAKSDQQKLTNIRQEIQSRADQGNPEAIQLMGQIQSQAQVNVEVNNQTTPHAEVGEFTPQFSPTIEMHASAPEEKAIQKPDLKEGGSPKNPKEVESNENEDEDQEADEKKADKSDQEDSTEEEKSNKKEDDSYNPNSIDE